MDKLPVVALAIMIGTSRVTNPYVNQQPIPRFMSNIIGIDRSFEHLRFQRRITCGKKATVVQNPAKTPKYSIVCIRAINRSAAGLASLIKEKRRPLFVRGVLMMKASHEAPIPSQQRDCCNRLCRAFRCPLPEGCCTRSEAQLELSKAWNPRAESLPNYAE